jgi:hypothetical protein
MERGTGGQTYIQTDRQMDGRTDERTDRQTVSVELNENSTIKSWSDLLIKNSLIVLKNELAYYNYPLYLISSY